MSRVLTSPTDTSTVLRRRDVNVAVFNFAIFNVANIGYRYNVNVAVFNVAVSNVANIGYIIYRP